MIHRNKQIKDCTENYNKMMSKEKLWRTFRKPEEREINYRIKRQFGSLEAKCKDKMFTHGSMQLNKSFRIVWKYLFGFLLVIICSTLCSPVPYYPAALKWFLPIFVSSSVSLFHSCALQQSHMLFSASQVFYSFSTPWALFSQYQLYLNKLSLWWFCWFCVFIWKSLQT